MYCKHCGSTIPDNSRFCPNCGGEAQESPAVDLNPITPAANPKSVLVFGILGLAFGCTGWLAFLGIIFSAIALKKARAYASVMGSLTGTAKVGRILGKIGLIFSIVMVAVMAFAFVIGVMAGIGAIS